MIEFAEYTAWLSALVDVVYSPGMANLPVYLDIEDDVLTACVQRVEPKGDHTVASAHRSLISAVRPTVGLAAGSTPRSVLAFHVSDSNRWRRQRRTGAYDPAGMPPPSIPLLAVMSRAAEVMVADNSYAATNYYDRLLSLLGFSPTYKGLLVQGISRDSERLWDDLNTWLDDLGGSRGLPTAEPIGHRYVGLPISQAMLRAADRAKFSEFFNDAGFAPGQSMALPDLAEYVDQWLIHRTLGPQTGITALQATWKRPRGKEVMTQSLSTALSLWDGSPSEGSVPTGRGRGILLTARIARQGAFSPLQIHLSVALRGRLVGPGALPAEWQVTSSTDTPPPRITFRAEDDRFLVPNLRLEGVANQGLLEGRVVIAPVNPESLPVDTSAPQLERKPLPVVVLVNMGSSTFIEVEHAQMGEDHIVLVNEAATNRQSRSMFGPGGVQDIGRHLETIAQPGFVRLPAGELPGLPEGWAVFRDVRIMARLSTDAISLEPLVTLQRGTLSVVGGLRLPGLTRRWSTEAPLTISAAIAESESIAVRLICQESQGQGEQGRSHEWRSSTGQLVERITGVQRVPGHYRLELSSPADDTNTRQSFSFHQVSADHPRMTAEISGPSPTEPREVGTATHPHPRWQEAGHARHPRIELPLAPWWMEQDSRVRVVTAAEPDAGGCAITGAHREFLTTNRGEAWDRGTCQGCGMVRMYRARPVGKGSLTAPVTQVAVVQNAADLPAFAASEVDGAAVLDALGWLGSGNAQELAYVLRQAAANSLGADELLRMLESMGHLDVVRGDDMTILNWGMARPTLAQTRQGQWSVIGTWGAEKLRQLRLANDEASLPRIISSSEDFLPVRLLTAQQTDLAPIAARLGVRLLPAAGLSLLRTLRPLGEIGRSLPRVKVDGFFEGERFDLSVGRWVPCSTISAAVGAYRVSRGFTRQYLFRNSTDLINGTASIATPQLAKHLAAQALGKPLMAYSPASQELFVPLGSEVPGLYGRALTQLSGRPAVRVQGSPSLVYRSVGQGEADHVAALLMN